MPISLADARRIADAALAEGERRGAKMMSIVVTDPGGDIRLAMRTDAQGIFGVQTATAKAVSALGYNRPTVALTDLFSPAAVAGITAATGGRFAPIGGGVVVTDADGAIVGGAGISGGPPAIDHEIIVAALEACGFHTLP